MNSVTEKMYTNQTSIDHDASLCTARELTKFVEKFDNYVNSKNPKPDYDYNGAIVYIIVITLFYSISVLAIIRIQTKKKTDFYEYDEEDEYSSYKPESVLREWMDEKNVKKEVLEDLRDPKKRAELWALYDKEKPSQIAQQNELKRLQQINKKLKQYYKDSPEYYNRTIDNSTLGRSESRPMIPIFKTTSTDASSSQTQTSQVKRIRVTSESIPTQNEAQKVSRFQVANVNETNK